MLKFLNKNSSLKIILVTWIFLWLSIGVTPKNLEYNLLSFSDIINIFRVFTPVIFTVILFILIILIKLFYKKDKNKENYFCFVNLFLVYFFLQVIGLYQNEFLKFNLENLYLVILGLGVLAIFIINKFFDNRNYDKLLHVSIVICFLSSTIIFFLLGIKNNFYTFLDIIYINLRAIYDINLDNKFLLNTWYPRSTGISRTFALINVFIIIYLLFFIKKKTIKYLFYFISFIYTSLIWFLQSRGSLLIFFVTISMIIFFMKNKIKYKIFLFFLIIFLPIILSQSVVSIASNFNKKKASVRTETNIQLENLRALKDYSSSGRITIWEESLKTYNRNKIFGYGPQGDRFLLENKEKVSQFSNNASNALIYSLLSGGYLAVLVFLLIYFSILKKIYICIIRFKVFQNNEDINIKLSVSFALFFFLRSFIENSFSLFSIDFLIFIYAAVHIENYLKKRQHFFRSNL
jgi:O-antigen ligase